jgi:hypothetical protein
MELWPDIFNENLPLLRNRFVKRQGCAAKCLLKWLWKNPCVVLTSIGGRQLQCLTSPKEQIALPTKIDFYSWRRHGSTWLPEQQSPPQSTICRSEPTRKRNSANFYRRLSSILGKAGHALKLQHEAERYDYFIDSPPRAAFS